MGVPVVSTSVGAEGLSLVQDAEIAIRDDPGAWADVIATLLADEPGRRRMAAAARARVEAEYDWTRIGRRFAEALAESAGPVAPDR